jgi:hypothetical protein
MSAFHPFRTLAFTAASGTHDKNTDVVSSLWRVLMPQGAFHPHAPDDLHRVSDCAITIAD